MSYETASGLRFDLYECGGKRPADMLKPYLPTEAVRQAWIPQTLGEQVWALFDFASEAERRAWEKTLPPSVSRFLDRSLFPFAADHYGWEIRDYNGFSVSRS